MVAFRGHFDGKVFVPDEPVDLPRNQQLVLHVEIPTEHPANGASDLWQILDQHTGSVEAPADWSAEHDHYLYGTPKAEK
jgi:hypothetical protein